MASTKIRDPRIPQASLRGGAGTHGDRRLKRHSDRPRSQDLIKEALIEHTDEVMVSAVEQVEEAAALIDLDLQEFHAEHGNSAMVRGAVRGRLEKLADDLRNGKAGS